MNECIVCGKPVGQGSNSVVFEEGYQAHLNCWVAQLPKLPEAKGFCTTQEEENQRQQIINETAKNLIKEYKAKQKIDIKKITKNNIEEFLNLCNEVGIDKIQPNIIKNALYDVRYSKGVEVELRNGITGKYIAKYTVIKANNEDNVNTGYN